MYERLRAWVRPLGAGENLPLVALLLVNLQRFEQVADDLSALWEFNAPSLQHTHRVEQVAG